MAELHSGHNQCKHLLLQQRNQRNSACSRNYIYMEPAFCNHYLCMDASNRLKLYNDLKPGSKSNNNHYVYIDRNKRLVYGS